MTLDEAIKRYADNAKYERTHGNLQGCLEFRQLVEWLKDYKRLLEQEPCEDAISRQAVINQIFYSTDNNGDVVLGSALRERIARLPSVTPQEPKTGHWIRELIRNKKGGCIGAKRICSECNNDNKHDEYMNYCPNCGAKMVEPQESEDKCKNCEYYRNPDYIRCHECKAESEDKE